MIVRTFHSLQEIINMGEGKAQNPQENVKKMDHDHHHHHQAKMISLSSPSSSLSSSIGDDDDSTVSNGSSSSSNDAEETRDDASSTATCSSSSTLDLSELMAELPIKRGLSQFYHGKSDSFTCLSMVTSIEDLPKKEAPFVRKKKKKGLEAYKLYTLPRAKISKKSSPPRRSFFNSAHKKG